MKAKFSVKKTSQTKSSSTSPNKTIEIGEKKSLKTWNEREKGF